VPYYLLSLCVLLVLIFPPPSSSSLSLSLSLPLAIWQLSEKLTNDLIELKEKRCLLGYISALLLHYTPQFRAYQSYMENYDDAVRTLNRLLKEKQELKTWLDFQQKCEGNNLQSFLISPVQRLPRYLLLLEQLKKNTDKSMCLAVSDSVCCCCDVCVSFLYVLLALSPPLFFRLTRFPFSFSFSFSSSSLPPSLAS
jgi:hypothetical protein